MARVPAFGLPANRSRRTERAAWLPAADVLLSAGAVSLAVVLRLDDGIAVLPSMGAVVLLLMFVQPLVNARLGLDRKLWPYASPMDYAHVLAAVVTGTVTTLVLYYIAVLPTPMAVAPLPLSFWAIVGLLNLVAMGGIRYFIRIITDWSRERSKGQGLGAGVPTLLYGAGEAGAMMARSTRSDPSAGIAPIAFLDDDVTRHGRYVARLPVLGGLDRLQAAIAHTGASRLLITMPNASGRRVRQIVEAARAAGLKVQTVPALQELLDAPVSAFRVRDIRVEDLLMREPLTERASEVTSIVRNQTVMITGAGGSIGSELARQVFGMEPARLVLIDRAEGPLFAIEQDLRLLERHGQGSGELVIHLANVASRAVITRIVGETQPNIIFHAAAYKHVPMMEQHPSDAVQVNVGGTMSVLDAALSQGVERFVFVSTDKAVEPASVMGASKRIGEALVAEAANASGRPYVSVRFGNVLGSSGSVVPIFKKQLEDGEPLTITHPDMTRFFMTIPEAVWLILDAASFGTPGDLFVLDMGEPVRIVDLARDLIRLAGRDPETTPIEFVGMRPGEKLFEQLFYDREGARPTANPRVLLADGLSPVDDLRRQVARLLDMATGDADDALRQSLFQLIDGVAKPPPAAALPQIALERAATPQRQKVDVPTPERRTA